MKKIFGVFAASAAALSLASCGDKVTQEDLAGLFETAFSDGRLTNKDNYVDGTYSVNSNFRVSDEEVSLEGSISKNNKDFIAKLSVEEIIEYSSNSDVPKVKTNNSDFILNVNSGYIKDFYVNLVSTGTHEDIEEENLIADILTLYGDLYTDVDSNPDSYDYVRFSNGTDSFSSQFIMNSIIGDATFGDTSTITDIFESFDHTISDFLIDEFTTYELKSQTEAYAMVEFMPFNELSYDLVFDIANTLAEFEGQAITDEEFREIWNESAAEYSDLVIPVKLGINPSAVKINYIQFDTEVTFDALGYEGSYVNFEIRYADSQQITLPTTRVLDGNVMWKEVSYEALGWDTFEFLHDNNILNVDLDADTVEINNESLASIAGKSINEISSGLYFSIPYAWFTMFDLDAPLVTKTGEDYYFNPKWVDGNLVLSSPVKIVADADFADTIYASINDDNFRFEYLLF